MIDWLIWLIWLILILILILVLVLVLVLVFDFDFDFDLIWFDLIDWFDGLIERSLLCSLRMQLFDQIQYKPEFYKLN